MPNVLLWQIRKQQINKFLINQSVGEKNKPVLFLLANKKRNKTKKKEYFWMNINRRNYHHLMLNQSFHIEEDLVCLYKVMHDDVMLTLMLLMYYPSSINKKKQLTYIFIKFSQSRKYSR
jgi:hypothetical protein